MNDTGCHHPPGDGCIRTLIRLWGEDCVLSRLAGRFPGVEFEVHDRQPLPGSRMLAGITIKHSRDAERFLKELSTSDEVNSLKPVHVSPYHFRLRVEFGCRFCLLCKVGEELRISSDCLYCSGGSMVVAFSLRDHGEFRELVRRLRELEAEFQVVEVRREGGKPSLQGALNLELTAKQREILSYAYRAGYFDRDRKVNLKEIAEHFGLSPATVGVHMRVALKKILKKVM